MTVIGYARVSTSGQTLDAQLEQLGGAGCARVFRETMSGARSDRPQLTAALNALEAGDTLIITRLDRLARSTRDLLDIVHTIETKGATLKALTESWADTTTPTGKLILTVLGGLAEFERTLIAGSHRRRPRPCQKGRKTARATLQAHNPPTRCGSGYAGTGARQCRHRPYSWCIPLDNLPHQVAFRAL